MKTVYSLLIVLLLASCGKELEERNAFLENEVEQLNGRLDSAEMSLAVLQEVTILMDSIEDERNILGIEMVESGIGREELAGRVDRLNGLLDNAETRIAELEKGNKSYAGLVRKLRRDIEARDRDIDALETLLDEAKGEIVKMAGAISLKEATIDGLNLEIEKKVQELALLEEEIIQMADEAKISEADAFYARGVAYEEAARRTKLAPRKKKETLRQALDLYLKSEELGKEEAGTKVKELQALLN